MSTSELQHLIQVLAKLPGLGPRSGRRTALHLLQHREMVLEPLLKALTDVSQKIVDCSVCGNLDTQNPCTLCGNEKRDSMTLCVVETVADLWALERISGYSGQYHVLGGTLSALEGIGPEDLRITPLLNRCQTQNVTEVILALNATVEGQTTAHYLLERLRSISISKITSLARGVPIGGELDYLDEGTLTMALLSRRNL